jgi:LysR family glycine cleavage system transcriptional activator
MMNSPHATAPARRLPSVNMLRAFEAAARHRSVTRAAQELSVTQSAVSHQIKALEAWLGVTLVVREGRQLGLTPQGTAYLPSLSSAFDLMADATTRIQRLTQRRVLSVNALSTLSAHWLIPRLGEFCAQVPNVDVQLATTASLLDFGPADFDVSIRCLSASELAMLRARPAWRSVQFGAFLHDVMTPLCSPALLSRSAALKKPADLARYTLLHSRSTPLVWRDWLAAAKAAKLQPASELVFDHVHLAVQAAVQGMGVAISNPHLVPDWIRSGLLVAPFESCVTQEKEYYWILSERSADDADAVAFCEWLTACGAAMDAA